MGCGVDGFPATKGWDPVTGFGTPVSFGYGLRPTLTGLIYANSVLGLPEVGEFGWGEDSSFIMMGRTSVR